jgi:uncharacterized protein involved in exopolysaccharide biosynthesis
MHTEQTRAYPRLPAPAVASAPAEAEGEERKARRPGRPLDPHRVQRTIIAGRWLLLATATAASIAGLLIGKFAIGHTYEAQSSIRYEGLPGQQPHEAQAALPALVSITHSDGVMIELRERMALDGASLEAMRAMVQVQSDPGTGLVSFTTSGETAEESARMGRELVTLFLEHHSSRRQNEIANEIRSLDDRRAAARADLASARRAYDTFRERNHITDLSAEQEAAITSAAELRSEADLAQAEIGALEARVAQLEGALARTPRMEASSTGTSAQGMRIRELQTRLREARGSLSDEHPQVQALQRQIEALQRQGGGGTTVRMTASNLYSEIQTSLGEARAELEATRQRHASLDQLAGQARERTNRFSTIEGQAAGLLAQVNVAEALLGELDQQRAHAYDELRDIQTGFRTVAEARPPESPVASKKKYIVAAAIPAFCLFVVIGLLLARELRGLRVKTPSEVAFWGNGAVIGSTTWPRHAGAVIDLVADLDDYAPEARGTMLLVAAREEDQDLASEIASQLNHDWSTSTLVDVPVIRTRPIDPDAEGEDGPPGSALVLIDSRDDDETALALAPSAYEIEGFADGHLAAYDDGERDFEDPNQRLICTAWTGPAEGTALRRAARLADRVLVVVASGALSAIDVAATKNRLGRSEAVGFVVVAASDDVARLPDRIGPIEEFWRGAQVAR